MIAKFPCLFIQLEILSTIFCEECEMHWKIWSSPGIQGSKRGKKVEKDEENYNIVIHNIREPPKT